MKQFPIYPMLVCPLLAEEHRHNTLKAYARQLCDELNIDPDADCIGPFLHTEPCDDNLDATIRWLKQYIDEEDILDLKQSFDTCASEFRKNITRVIHTDDWGTF